MVHFPSEPYRIYLHVGVPAGTNGDQVIASLATSQASGTSYQTMAKPDPPVTVLRSASIRSAAVHTADSNRNGKINLTELTRVIERQNSTTTGLAPPASASTSHSLVRRMASRLGRPRSFRRRESLAPPAR